VRKIQKWAVMVGALIAVVFLAGCVPGAAPSGGQSGGDWTMIIFLVAIFAIFYFLMIRPQRKRQQTQKKMMQDLNKGDKIVTIGGIYGVIESVTEDSFVIKVESGATIRMARHAIAAKRNQ